jgi:hypothetical protein
MRSKLYIIQTFLFLIFIGCQSSKHTQNLETEKDYIFFIHNKFLEENSDGTFSDKYNVTVDYNGILQSFKKDGFIVLSEKRIKNTDTKKYAKKLPPTGVLQKLGFSAKLNIWNTNEHCAKFEHSYF